MGSASIGIKLADSTFYPVLHEGAPASKILDLTTVRDDQTSVQINLFRSESESIDDSEYVGTLIIEEIAAKPSGEPTIELKLSLDESNELSAEAVDLDSGSRQVLNVSLETLDKDSVYNLPDFDLTPVDSSLDLGGDPSRQNVVVDSAIPGNAPEGLYEMENQEEKRSGIFLPAWACILILAVGVLALVLALLVSARVMILNKTLTETAARAPQAVEAPAVPTTEPAPAPAPAETVTPPPVETPAETPAPEPTVVETPVVPAQPEAAPEAKPVRYKIKWGDTLWDLAESYYRNPWQYKKIATFNKIKNPNLIIAGTWLDIPPK